MASETLRRRSSPISRRRRPTHETNNVSPYGVVAALLTTTSALAQTQSGGGAQSGGSQPQTPSQSMPPGQNPDSTMGPGAAGASPSKVDDKKFVKDAALGGIRILSRRH